MKEWNEKMDLVELLKAEHASLSLHFHYAERQQTGNPILQYQAAQKSL
jgi:hypothetical protein